MNDDAGARVLYAADLLGGTGGPGLRGALAERFGLPPFTVMSARDGWWQSRKKAWIALGLQSELGRGANTLSLSVFAGNIDFYALKRELEAELGRTLTTDEAKDELAARGQIGLMDSGAGRDGNLLGLSPQAEDYRNRTGDYAADARRAEKRATPGGGGGPNSRYLKTAGGKKADAQTYGSGAPGDLSAEMRGRETASLKGGLTSSPAAAKAYNDHAWMEDKLGTAPAEGSGTSIFDPVLCELCYRWFSAPGHQIIDPFAGGSVRGIVAGLLGRRYWGCDLSAAQVAANEAQRVLMPAGTPVEWVVGDAAECMPEAPVADLLIGCPPYFNLEVYSDDPRDLSAMDWAGFRASYADIIAQAAGRLRRNRFAVFVTGHLRDKDGFYRGLPNYTVRCFEAAGLRFYDEAILVTAVGSLPIRTERQFEMSRKLGRTHQYVQVFVKGDPKLATDAATGMSYAERRAVLANRDAARDAAVSWDEGGGDGTDTAG